MVAKSTTESGMPVLQLHFVVRIGQLFGFNFYKGFGFKMVLLDMQ